MVDYEKLAEEVHSPGESEALGPLSASSASAPASEPSDSSPPKAPFGTTPRPEPLSRASREFLPLNHEKYQGIAGSKGYAQGDDFSGTRLKRVHYSHEAMIDVIIAEPTLTQNELAKRFERSVSWISIVMGSDSFQAALAKRRDDLTDPFLIATIEERFRGLAQQSLSVIAEKLETTRNPDLALKALEISSKALGFGARNTNPGSTTNNFVVQLPPKIATAAEWATAHSTGPLLEG